VRCRVLFEPGRHRGSSERGPQLWNVGGRHEAGQRYNERHRQSHIRRRRRGCCLHHRAQRHVRRLPAKYNPLFALTRLPPPRYHKGVRHGHGLLTVKGAPGPSSYSLAGEWRKGELNGRVSVTWGGGCQLQANISNGTIVAPAFAILKPGDAFVLHEGGWYTGVSCCSRPATFVFSFGSIPSQEAGVAVAPTAKARSRFSTVRRTGCTLRLSAPTLKFMPPYCSGEFIRGQANGAGSLWRVATSAAADLDSDGSASPACGFIGSFTNGLPQGLGVGCRPAATLPAVAVSDLMHVCSYTAGGAQGEACAFSGMWGGGSPGGMGVMAGGSCVMMCSGFDADGVQVPPPPIPPLLLLLLLTFYVRATPSCARATLASMQVNLPSKFNKKVEFHLLTCLPQMLPAK
jgi:hypothetical protein